MIPDKEMSSPVHGSPRPWQRNKQHPLPRLLNVNGFNHHVRGEHTFPRPQGNCTEGRAHLSVGPRWDPALGAAKAQALLEAPAAQEHLPMPELVEAARCRLGHQWAVGASGHRWIPDWLGGCLSPPGCRRPVEQVGLFWEWLLWPVTDFSLEVQNWILPNGCF